MGTLRGALFATCTGNRKAIASEAFPTLDVERGDNEITRTLGENADRRPTLALIETALALGDRAPFEAWYAERFGVEIRPRRRDAGELLDLVETRLAALDEEVSGVRSVLDELRMAQRVGPHRVPAPSSAEGRKRA
jgi:hypothetical protein